MAAHPEQEETSFVEFLKQKGLEKYASELEKHGITCQADLLELNETDLVELGKQCNMLLGHVAKFRNLVISSPSSSSSSSSSSSFPSSSSSSFHVESPSTIRENIATAIPLSVPEMEAMKQFGQLHEMLQRAKEEWERLGRDHVKAKLAEGYTAIQQACNEARAAIDKEEQRAIAQLQSLVAQLLDTIQTHSKTVTDFIAVASAAEQECTAAFRNTTLFSQVHDRERTILSTTKRVFETSFPRLGTSPQFNLAFNLPPPRFEISCELDANMQCLVPSILRFVGFSNPFKQSERKYTTEEQDAIILKAVQDQYGKGARPLSAEEYEDSKIEITGLPSTNTSGSTLIFVYPGRRGSSASAYKSGFHRVGVGLSQALNRVCSSTGAGVGTRRTIVVAYR